MPRTIKIPSWQEGGTLSQIATQYNTTVDELMRLNPNIRDRDKIIAGATLTLPTLAGTLETGGEKEKTLPFQPVDKLSMFGDVLKMITQRAAKQATARGAAALPEGMLKPEQVSGRTFADVLRLVTEQKTRGIADIYESTVKMIDQSRTRAKDQLQMLVNTGAIKDLDDGTLKKLAELTDFDFEYLQSVRTVKQEQAQKATAKMTDLDRVNDLNKFLSGKIGGDGKISAESYIGAYKKWISLGGSVSDFRYAYPVEEWLGEWEYEKLPSGWRPKAEPTVPGVKTLSEDQQIFINQVQAKINNYEITYDEAVVDFPDIVIYLKPAR